MTLRRTPFYAHHESAGAKLIDFGGWEMPVRYTKQIEEHLRVRSSVGLFDVSHMGEVRFRGARALDAVRHLVRLDVAKELAFTGRVVSGSEAVELGLATQLSDTPLDAALEMAREIAAKSPNAIRANKQLFNDTRHLDVEAGLKLEERLQGSLIASPNQVEAVKANMQKRQPEFTDPD